MAADSAGRLADLSPLAPGNQGRPSPSVNACYNATTNDITFPAGILQPPFFDALADDALNYGAIGAVIGHEMTHGFDDQGSKYDAAGNLANWWTAKDRAGFDVCAAKLVGQFNARIAIGSRHINGELTLGENIADLGGLCIALDAYNRSLNGKPAPVIDGLTRPHHLRLTPRHRPALAKVFFAPVAAWRLLRWPEWSARPWRGERVISPAAARFSPPSVPRVRAGRHR